MSITNKFNHEFDNGFEQYTFRSEVNKDRDHFIDRVGGDLWQISLADLPESLSIEQAKALVREIELLCEFVEKLNRTELHSHTEPGAHLHGEGDWQLPTDHELIGADA